MLWISWLRLNPLRHHAGPGLRADHPLCCCYYAPRLYPFCVWHNTYTGPFHPYRIPLTSTLLRASLCHARTPRPTSRPGLASTNFGQYTVLRVRIAPNANSQNTVIETITSHREPQQFEAMYLLMSTSQNVDRIIRDFSNGRQQYAGAHLFFIDGA